MIISYLKLAARILLRSPVFAFVNVAGLSVGLAVFIVLWQYTQRELKSDQFVSDFERIYRLVNTIDFSYDGERFITPHSVYDPYSARELANRAPQVEAFTRILNQHGFGPAWISDHGNQLFFTVPGKKSDDKYFVESRVAYADPNLFDFFGIPLLTGDVKQCLSMPDNIVLASSIARKYFKDQDPTGKVILLNDSIPLTVSGVFSDLPVNTHLEFQAVISMLRIAPQLASFRISSHGGPYSYLKLRPGASMASLDRILEQDGKQLSIAVTHTNSQNTTITPWLQPLPDIAFRQLWGDHFLPKSETFLRILEFIAIVVLVVAWINYVNLTLSSNAGRYRELAARKTIGARSGDFIAQFVMEALVTNVVSFALAATVVQLVRPLTLAYLGFDTSGFAHLSWRDLSVVMLILLGGVAVTGLYPAYVVTRLSAGNLMKGSLAVNAPFSVTKTLVVVQYTCAIILIIGAFTVNRQLGFILSKDIGINRDQVIVIDLPIKRSNSFISSLDNFRRSIKKLPFIDGYTVSNNVVGDIEENSVFIKHVDRESGFVPDCNGGVDENFLSFYDVPLLAGRNFSGFLPTDTTAVLLSRQAAARMGYNHPEEMVGTKILVQRKEFSAHYAEATVIGVFQDYKRMSYLAAQESSRKGDNIGTLLMYHDDMVPAQLPRKISIRVAGANVAAAIEGIQKYFEYHFPGNAFNWYYLDQNISRYYKYERMARNQVIVFTAVVICISCLGLLGMLMHQLARRQKEIGIRKVLGAQLTNIGALLLSSTSRLFILALVIGLPMAWYATQRYLERFSEKVPLTWWHYLMPVMLFAIIMSASVISMVWKAATANPADVLKHE